MQMATGSSSFCQISFYRAFWLFCWNRCAGSAYNIDYRGSLPTFLIRVGYIFSAKRGYRTIAPYLRCGNTFNKRREGDI